MNIIVNSQSLKGALKLLSPDIAANSIIPICECVKFLATPTKLYLFGSDLETSIKTSVPCEADSEFSFCIDFKEINDLCNLIDEGALYFSLTINKGGKVDQYRVDIKSVYGKNSYSGFDPIDFPNMPEIESDGKILLDKIWLDKIKMSTLFVSNDGISHPAMVGICFDVKSDGLNIAATSAHTLYKSESIPHPFSFEAKKVLPAKPAKILSNNPTCCNIDFSPNRMKFSDENTEIYCRLIDQTFPAYNNVIPEYSHSFCVNKSKLIAAIKYAMLAASKTTNACMIELKDSAITVFSNDVDFAKNSDCSPFEVTQNSLENFKVALNGTQLLTCLIPLTEDVIFSLNINSPATYPVILTNDKSGELTLCMPLQIAI